MQEQLIKLIEECSQREDLYLREYYISLNSDGEWHLDVAEHKEKNVLMVIDHGFINYTYTLSLYFKTENMDEPPALIAIDRWSSEEVVAILMDILRILP